MLSQMRNGQGVFMKIATRDITMRDNNAYGLPDRLASQHRKLPFNRVFCLR
jgi:hypothetical protein